MVRRFLWIQQTTRAARRLYRKWDVQPVARKEERLIRIQMALDLSRMSTPSAGSRRASRIFPQRRNLPRQRDGHKPPG